MSDAGCIEPKIQRQIYERFLGFAKERNYFLQQ